MPARHSASLQIKDRPWFVPGSIGKVLAAVGESGLPLGGGERVGELSAA
jgi:hypothetical protein